MQDPASLLREGRGDSGEPDSCGVAGQRSGSATTLHTSAVLLLSGWHDRGRADPADRTPSPSSRTRSGRRRGRHDQRPCCAGRGLHALARQVWTPWCHFRACLAERMAPQDVIHSTASSPCPGRGPGSRARARQWRGCPQSGSAIRVAPTDSCAAGAPS